MTHEVPDGWVTETLGSIGSFSNGINKGKEDFGFGVPFFNLQDIFGEQSVSALPNGLVNASPKEVARYKVNRGDVLFVRSSVKPEGVGKTAVVLADLPDSVYSGFIIRFRPNDGVFAAPYLKYAFHENGFRRRLLAKSTINANTNINQKALETLSVLIPPPPEQKKIAEVLSSVDEAIAATKAVIDQTKQVKKGLRQTLLTKGIGHTKFKQTELGEIPVSWEVVELGDLVEALKAGVSVNSENRSIRDNESGILKTSCVTNGFFDAAEHKAILSHELARAKTPVKADSIIISRMNTPALVGANAYVAQDYPNLFLPDRLWQLSVKDTKKTLVRWLSFVLASDNMRARISGIATGTSGSMKNISKAKLLSLLVAVPKRDEQGEISEILSSFEHELGILHRYISELESLKTGLMSDLLTGRKRVEVLDA